VADALSKKISTCIYDDVEEIEFNRIIQRLDLNLAVELRPNSLCLRMLKISNGLLE